MRAPRDKTLSTKQLGAALDKYLAEVGQDVQHTGPTDFVLFLEQETQGRLVPTSERLACTALAMVVDGEINKLAQEAVASTNGRRGLEE